MTRCLSTLALLLITMLLTQACSHSPPNKPSKAPKTTTDASQRKAPKAQATRVPASEIQLTRTCNSGKVDWNNYAFCIWRHQGSKSTDVVYYFHGNGGDETSWDSPEHRALYSEWTALGIDSPVVISVSFGNTWFLSEQTGFFSRSYYDSFIDGVISTVEAQLGHPVTTRTLMGESMGGFNAARLYLRAPQLFQRAAVLCPAILTLGPHSSKSDVNAYLARHQPYVRRDLVELWLKKMVKEYPTHDVWLAHDPVAFASITNPKWIPLYLLVDDHDAFGFNEGAFFFRQALITRGAPLESIVIKNGAHCEQSADSIQRLAKFLTAK
jgi:pimeloyl-ACP methyl ester carboxylesterase